MISFHIADVHEQQHSVLSSIILILQDRRRKGIRSAMREQSITAVNNCHVSFNTLRLNTKKIKFASR
ncbi:unnamed protein product [Litomosoides sigmodontis]|uniref:Uncharacterized protein n=1 Tax=Litomosoides sigmodontis TaxID=42156 RepID=A0A3P7JP29_LITSI|nr:unnamed protein product [Litomosoides sigmodontis]